MIEKPIEITELAAGAANQVLRLRGATESYIFKWLKHNRRFGLNRDSEFKLQQQLAESGLAPNVLALDPDQWVLQEYVDGTPMTSFKLNPSEKLQVTAQALALVHQQQPRWAGDDIWQKTARYTNKLDTSTRQQLLQFQRALQTKEPDVLCHFDLAFAHILVNDSITIVDWEYAGWGDRLTDIASTIEINQLNDSCCDALCHYYKQETGITIDKHRLHDHRLFTRWLYQQWSRLLAQGELDE